MRVIVDPRSKVLYSSYYIHGLRDIAGKKNLIFSLQPFKSLDRRSESFSHDHYMAFIVEMPEVSPVRIVIDFSDPPVISDRAYQWSDRYAKINFNPELTDISYHAKIVSIPPGFGVRIWNLWSTGYHAVSNLIKSGFKPIVPFDTYLLDYIRQYRRPALDEYHRDTSLHNSAVHNRPFIFLIGSLWRNQEAMQGTNLMRKAFIEKCKTLECDFEGGFFCPAGHPQYDEFKELIFNNRYPAREYLQKTKESWIVFNTPAMHNCHGWKLGEYIAMHKAIISTPILNELPAKLLHGVHIHIVADISELRGAIDLILKNDNYRKSLEEGVRSYYLEYSSPKAVIGHILKAGLSGL